MEPRVVKSEEKLLNKGIEVVKDEDGEYWYLDGNLHRDNDLPAVENTNGYRAWWVNGQRHRDNGPAIIRENGTRGYWLNGKRLDDGLVAFLLYCGILLGMKEGGKSEEK